MLCFQAGDIYLELVVPYAFLNLCNPKFFTGHTPLVIHPVGFHTEIIFIRAVNEWSRIGEVGVDLELCVHAHGNNVDRIIKASLQINISLV